MPAWIQGQIQQEKGTRTEISIQNENEKLIQGYASIKATGKQPGHI
jgi:hypothetical protein